MKKNKPFSFFQTKQPLCFVSSHIKASLLRGGASRPDCRMEGLIPQKGISMTHLPIEISSAPLKK